jgi:hypothetical protein
MDYKRKIPAGTGKQMLTVLLVCRPFDVKGIDRAMCGDLYRYLCAVVSGDAIAVVH